MEIISDRLHDRGEQPALIRVPLRASRLDLSKRRWRGVASDGTEFGFDLEHPLADGDAFFEAAGAFYQIEQEPEPILEVVLGSASDAARLGWKIGNLHFQIAVTGDAIHAPDDPAVRQLLEREGIAHHQVLAVFRPLSGSHSHGTHAH